MNWSGEYIRNFLALSDERSRAEVRRLRERREDYRAGYQAAIADMQRKADEEWAGVPPRPAAGLGPTHAELEIRRWGPGGRRAAIIRPEHRI